MTADPDLYPFDDRSSGHGNPRKGRAPVPVMSLLQTPAAWTGGPGDLPAGPVAEAVREAVARSTPAEALRAVIDMAVHSGPGDAASITMLGPRRALDTVACSDERVRDVDHLQYALGEGPSLDAVWTNGVFIVPDLVADGRWPRWAPRAADLGIGA